MPIENQNTLSQEVKDIITAIPNKIIRWGNVLFLALIILFLTLSWAIKYPDSISSEALITTQIPLQKEYAKITGKFAAILVEDNQKVVKNQPLAILENTANYKDVYKLKAIIETIQINNKSFHFPIDSYPILFLGDIELKYALFENSYIKYQLNKEFKPFSNEALAHNLSISELNNRLQSLRIQRDMNKTELNFKLNNLKRNKILFDKGVISAQEYDNKQLEYKQAERNYKNFETSISLIRESISNAKKTAKGTTIDKVREEMILLKNVIQSFNQLKKAIKDWEYQYVLKSKIMGNVSFLNYWNENQTVNQGDLVFTVIPKENTSFVAKLKTPAQNSGKLKIGQKVNIRLENYPATEFGTLNGTVKNISLTTDKDGFYLVDVKLPNQFITSYKKEIKFKQEMKGIAEIITEDLRLADRFFINLKKF